MDCKHLSPRKKFAGVWQGIFRKKATMLNSFFKASVIAVYLLAIASHIVDFPGQAGPIVQTMSVVLLLIHALECLLAYRYIKLYSGPLLVSLVLSLLFGLLHWMPLARKAREAALAQAQQ
jgi:uncharacterized protein YhhL (DUF1145 family)